MKRFLAWWIALTLMLTASAIPSLAEEDELVDALMLPASLKQIDEAAFEGDATLTAVVIPKSVAQIGPRAFADCTALKDVYFGNNADISIDRAAFEGCTGLNFYVFPETPAETYALAHGFDYSLMEPGSTFLEKALSIVAATGGTEQVLQSADFSSMRLIARTADNNLPDISRHNPVKIARDEDNTFFIQFDDVGTTIDCYQQLVNDAQVSFVDADANLELLDDVTAAGYVGNDWDTDDPMGFAAYSRYIAEKGAGSVTIAVIDSGVEPRAAYRDSLLEGINMVPDGQSWSYDPGNHGSAIASIIKDCVGDANVKILPVRVVGKNGIGSLTLIGAGIKSAIEQDVDVINLSLNFDPNAYVTQWIKVALSRGISVVVAAGNNSRDIRKVYPANVDGVVAVSGIDSSYRLSATSNYGDGISYCAPDMYVTPSAFSGAFSGTSFAAPMIAAALALNRLDPYHTVADMQESCRDLGQEGRDSAYGYGLPQLDQIAKVYVDEVALDKDIPDIMAVGESKALSWSVLPDYATDKTVFFESSDPDTLSVSTDADGQVSVKALKQGNAMISVIANNARPGSRVSASAGIMVVQPVTFVAVHGAGQKLPLNRKMSLSVETAPADATNPAVTWKTTNESVATVSEDGVLTPVSPGTVGVYATASDGYGAMSDVVNVEVVVVPDAESIVLSEKTDIDISSGSIEIVPNSQLHLAAQVLPEDAEQDVVWSCNADPKGSITIDTDGVVTAASAGTADIFATAANGVRANLKVEAVILPISLELEGETTIDVGAAHDFNVKFTPEDTTDTRVTWTSTRPDVADVDQNGKVTGVGAGMATIIAESTRNHVPGSIQVTVRQPYKLVFDANGGTLGTDSKTAYSDYPVGELPTPTRDYCNFTGWYTAADGGTRVTETTSLTCGDTRTIYAHWQDKPLSAWVLESEVPAGAKIVNRANPENTESTASTLAGWNSNGAYWKRTGGSSILYGSKPEGVRNTWINNQLEDGPLTAYNDGKKKREVSNTWAGYVYWHWMYDCGASNGHAQRAIYNRGAHYPSYIIAPANGYGYKYFGAFMDATNYPYGGTGYTCNLGWANYIVAHKTAWEDCQGATRWFRFDYYRSTYTDYVWTYRYTRTRVQYREK